MIKDELRKLRTLNATKQMMQKAEADDGVEKEEKGWNGNRYVRKYKYRYAMYLRCQNLSGYLKIAIFLPKDMKKGIDKARFEIFINPKAEEYITREYVKGKEAWRTAKIENLNYAYSGWSYLYSTCYKHSWINAEGAKTIRDVLKVEKTGFDGILEYQERILKQRAEEKYRREVQAFDDDMALIPEVPKNFMEWLRKKGIEEHFIFYHYDSKKEPETGFCSYCEKQVPVVKPRHNRKGKCPCCRRKITYKADGKIKRLETDTYDCRLIQKIEGGFVVRIFDGRKVYSNRTYENPSYWIHEYERTMYQEDIITQYRWENYKQKEYRWVRQKEPRLWGSIYGVREKVGLVYPSNIGVLEKTALKHSGLPAMLRRNKKMNVQKYITEERRNPAIEKLVKIGMYKLAENLIDHNNGELLYREETDLAKILKLDKQRLKRMKDMDGGISCLRWMQTEKENDTIYPDEMIRYFAEADINPGNLDFIHDRMTYTKIWNYLKKQKGYTKDSLIQIVITWKDYLNMAVKANMPVENEQIYKPKNLKEKHDEVVEILQQEGFRKKAEEVRKKFGDVDKICGELTKYEYESGKYCIVAPKGVEDIIREGTILQHCVHTCDFYWDRICQRETYLLFLRKTEEKNKPYYTLEVEPAGNIRQKRTTGDNQNKDFDDAIGFLKKWQKVIQKRLSKEDKELGKKSTEMRKKEYEKLRKDGNKVWHGKLAGRLLADVLEEDFMEVM